jgi:hypothetical protein
LPRPAARLVTRSRRGRQRAANRSFDSNHVFDNGERASDWDCVRGLNR